MKDSSHIANLRKEYARKKLSVNDVLPNPIEQFESWFNEAMQAKIDEVNAMTLSTVCPQGRPSARIVLLKGVENKGFVFYTNYTSEKGRHLEATPYAALTFFWKELERQVRIEGSITKVSKSTSAAYFHSRPWKSQVGAWVSAQSQPLTSRFELMRKFATKAASLVGQQVPLPEFWGGYLLSPTRVEFWQGRPSRLHDRINYKLQESQWVIERLSP